MPIKRLSREKMNEYIQATRNYFAGFCPGKDLIMLNTCLSELLNNAYDHADSPIGAFVFSQFYPATRDIKLAVSDGGIGIPISVNAYRQRSGQAMLSERDCIQWALGENNTTKSIPQNRGKGLDTVQSFMRSTGNSWQLFSGSVLMRAFPSGIRYQTNPMAFFLVTAIQLNFKIDNLQEEQSEEYFDWF